MGKIGIIDADLLKRQKHRFPNLVCEKISGYWKAQGKEVELLTGEIGEDLLRTIDIFNAYRLEEFERIYVSKVFTDTPVRPLNSDNPKYYYGGTGFFFDQAAKLDDKIEHFMPDYHLYDKWIDEETKRVGELRGESFRVNSFRAQFREYLDYSIGFLTRGCFRHCKFCVNQRYDCVEAHSPLSEFLDPSRRKICLLDDNFLGFSGWRAKLEELIDTKKPFKFKQGLDERILTKEKCKLLFSANYDGDFTFAFDNVDDYDLIHKKLKTIREYTDSTSVKFYVLVGFASQDQYDIEGAFRRIKLLMKYKCLPYIMRYQSVDRAPWKHSEFHSMYVALARWANQPNMFKKMSFRQFCEVNQSLHRTEGTYCAAMQACVDFEKRFPEIAKEYFDLRYDGLTN